MKRENMGVDRFTTLPESIIHHIMSHMSTKEVVRTSVLSKRWFHMRKNYPVLEFPLTKKTKDLVYKSLHHFRQEKLLLQTFCVHMTDLNLSSDLDSLIGLALENQVKELRLTLNGRAISLWLYTLPQPIFSSKTLTTLKLSSCFLDQPLSAFSSLRKFYLEGCHVDGQIILENGDCPLLEDLGLLNCKGFGCVYVSDLSQLHSLEVSFDGTDGTNEFVISCQSLQSFTIRSCAFEPWSIVNMDGCNHLKSLHLQSKTITDSEFHSLLSKLPLLEELYLFHCDELKSINISCPRIKTLEICPEPECYSQLEFIGIDAPNLRNFIFLAKDKHCVIKIEDCQNLETLVLFWRLITDTLFHDLVSQFPLLVNLWVIGCQELQRIEIPNLQLKRLHIVRCFRLKAVEVDSPNLFELCCTGREAVEVSVLTSASGLRFECDHEDSPSTHWSCRLDDILYYFVRVEDESLIDIILNSAYEFPE
ncbi:hypothetical protein SLEP1_g45036 [Rubroshorea leprosula]|uniref:F-box domain-containing protein n=1 Tax=Rubroshorea leprosula TaxID=152421 RepID=A0AAV5LJ67_9ROSI|nr:hypothetical protein SLEP1_g45036 [Rubroshorea leprosula]